jgi:hypothetical protein
MMDDDEYRVVSAMIDRGTKYLEKTCPSATFPPKIPQNLTWDQTVTA